MLDISGIKTAVVTSLGFLVAIPTNAVIIYVLGILTGIVMKEGIARYGRRQKTEAR